MNEFHWALVERWLDGKLAPRWCVITPADTVLCQAVDEAVAMQTAMWMSAFRRANP